MVVKLLVYKIDDSNSLHQKMNSSLLSQYTLSITKPGLFGLTKFGQGFFVNLYWFLISFGKFEILQLHDSVNVVHYSYISPKVYRFPFMKKGDIQIGPCFTYKKYQKRGIYTYVLQYLISQYYNNGRNLWIYCNENNEASRKTIEKVGFKKQGFATINKLTKVIHFK